MNEIHIMEEIQHPSIVSFIKYYHDEENNTYWIIMAYLPWDTLRSFINEQTTLFSSSDLKKIMSQLIEILCFLNEKKLCHRDITIDNILISSETLEIKLIDFGVAKFLSNAEDFLLSPVGKIKFRAPELSDVGSYNLSYDIWQCGLIFAALASQEKVCSRSFLKRLGNKQVQELLTNKGLDLISKMLKKNPNERCDCFQAKNHEWFQEII